jgi:hypothetical protein
MENFKQIIRYQLFYISSHLNLNRLGCLFLFQTRRHLSRDWQFESHRFPTFLSVKNLSSLNQPVFWVLILFLRLHLAE